MQEAKIKPGYKMTELGVIPEDWDLKSFNESFEFLTSASFSRDDLDNIYETKCIHYGDIHTKWNYFLDVSKENIPGIDYNKAKKYPFLKDGDLIMAYASEDYAGICKSIEIKNIGNKKVISGLHTFLLRGKNNVFENGFKGYISSNKLVKDSYDRVATGLKVYGVSKGNLKNLYIPVPKLEEQKLIAQTLSDTDKLIKSLDKLIEKKEKIKEGAMQEFLTGKRRLPGFSGEWEKCKLGDIGELKNGYAFKSSSYNKNGVYKVITIANVQNGYMTLDGINKILSIPFDIQKHQVLKKGDILISMTGNVGRICIVNSENNLLNQRVGKLEFNNVDKKFIFYNLVTKKFIQSMIKSAQGGAQDNIGKNDILDFEFYIPIDNKEQKAITEVLSDMDNEIEALKTKRDKYKQVKEGMMQNLLTGKIRLV